MAVSIGGDYCPRCFAWVRGGLNVELHRYECQGGEKPPTLICANCLRTVKEDHKFTGEALIPTNCTICDRPDNRTISDLIRLPEHLTNEVIDACRILGGPRAVWELVKDVEGIAPHWKRILEQRLGHENKLLGDK